MGRNCIDPGRQWPCFFELITRLGVLHAFALPMQNYAGILWRYLRNHESWEVMLFHCGEELRAGI